MSYDPYAIFAKYEDRFKEGCGSRVTTSAVSESWSTSSLCYCCSERNDVCMLDAMNLSPCIGYLLTSYVLNNLEYV
jgi:hypothetical protein